MRRRDFENEEEWRCPRCGRLLGMHMLNGRIHLRSALRHEYIIDGSVSGICFKCRTVSVRSSGPPSVGNQEKEKKKKMPGS